jgi:hypothetical protein
MLLPSTLQMLQGCSADRNPTFKIFDSLGYDQKPQVGFTPLHIVDRGFWKTPARLDLDRSACERIARKVATKFSYLVIDIEHWQVDRHRDPIAEVKTSINKFVEVLGWMRSAAPSLKLSLYAIPPLRDYWSPVGRQTERLAAWRESNRFLKPIADACDFISPSLYTFYKDIPGWVTYAKANIAEAQQYGKPVYPFLWSRFHSTQSHGFQFIPGDYWRTQLETVRSQGADGLVLWDWGGYDRPTAKALDTRQGWWQETIKFSQTL